MGVVATDKWLDKYYDQPEKMCKMAKPEVKDEHDFYRYLTQFGMYRPSRNGLRMVEGLKEKEVWKQLDIIYKKYRKKWNGSKVDIYVFPINKANRFFMRQLKGRSGLSFSDKIFLFISDQLEEKDLEALFVHEYHHATRMTYYKKQPEDYTLLDSVIFEGFAEVAVLNNCGKAYTAYWTDFYSENQLKKYIEELYLPNFDITRKNVRHDELLFGGKNRIPTMLGYAVGYEISKRFIQSNQITILDTFTISSKDVLEKNSLFDS